MDTANPLHEYAKTPQKALVKRPEASFRNQYNYTKNGNKVHKKRDMARLRDKPWPSTQLAFQNKQKLTILIPLLRLV